MYLYLDTYLGTTCEGAESKVLFETQETQDHARLGA